MNIEDIKQQVLLKNSLKIELENKLESIQKEYGVLLNAPQSKISDFIVDFKQRHKNKFIEDYAEKHKQFCIKRFGSCPSEELDDAKIKACRKYEDLHIEEINEMGVVHSYYDIADRFTSDIISWEEIEEYYN